MADDLERRRARGEFLRARRAELTPPLVGMTAGPGWRRVPGLRREEVANLAGVSYSWYTRLEQGQDVHATAEVIDSIATALRLSDDEHRHLRRLAQLPLHPWDHDDEAIDDHIVKLLERQMPAPAYVIGPRFDYLAWNDALSSLFCDIGALPADRRHVLWATFAVPEVRSSLVDWEAHARSVIGQFRAEAAAHPNDERFAAKVAQLMAVSTEFRTWWATHKVVRAASGDQAFQHPSVGLVRTSLVQLRLIERPSLKVVIHMPLTPEDDRKLARLASA